MADVLAHGGLPVPNHLRNAADRRMKQHGIGVGYRNPHDFEGDAVQGDPWSNSGRLLGGEDQRSAAGVSGASMPLELTRSPWKLAPTASLHRRLAAVLEAIGERIAVPSSWACCGRPLYDAGMLGLARRTLTHLLDVLEPWTSRGIPVVVLEPSCLAAFRDELPAAAVTTYPGAPPGSTTEAS